MSNFLISSIPCIPSRAHPNSVSSQAILLGSSLGPRKVGLHHHVIRRDVTRHHAITCCCQVHQARLGCKLKDCPLLQLRFLLSPSPSPSLSPASSRLPPTPPVPNIHSFQPFSETPLICPRDSAPLSVCLSTCLSIHLLLLPRSSVCNFYHVRGGKAGTVVAQWTPDQVAF